MARNYSMSGCRLVPSGLAAPLGLEFPAGRGGQWGPAVLPALVVLLGLADLLDLPAPAVLEAPEGQEFLAELVME